MLAGQLGLQLGESSVAMPSREYILDEIRRVAAESGRPPGRQLFEKETGIRVPEWWGVHWRTWGDALEEAGFEANKIKGKLSTNEILTKYAEAVRHFGRIPTNVDLRMFSRERADFPSHTTFTNHFGKKPNLLRELTKFVHENDGFSDLIELLPRIESSVDEQSHGLAREGSVYLLKSGDYFKIGRSDELERRVKQISVQLPESVTLEHAIRTDDPPGIEAYWHRRFAERRANGEWFKLTSGDLRAFKRRKFQ